VIISHQQKLPRIPHAHPCCEWYCRERGIILKYEAREQPKGSNNEVERSRARSCLQTPQCASSLVSFKNPRRNHRLRRWLKEPPAVPQRDLTNPSASYTENPMQKLRRSRNCDQRSFGVSKNSPRRRTRPCPCKCYGKEKRINMRNEGRRTPSTKWNRLQLDHVSKPQSVLYHWRQSRNR
jgi:hypothetical protein